MSISALKNVLEKCSNGSDVESKALFHFLTAAVNEENREQWISVQGWHRRSKSDLSPEHFFNAILGERNKRGVLHKKLSTEKDNFSRPNALGIYHSKFKDMGGGNVKSANFIFVGEHSKAKADVNFIQEGPLTELQNLLSAESEAKVSCCGLSSDKPQFRSLVAKGLRVAAAGFESESGAHTADANKWTSRAGFICTVGAKVNNSTLLLLPCGYQNERLFTAHH